MMATRRIHFNGASTYTYIVGLLLLSSSVLVFAASEGGRRPAPMAPNGSRSFHVLTSKLSPSPTRTPPAAFVDPSTIVEVIGTFARNNPYATAFLATATKGGIADVVAQKSESIDDPPPYFSLLLGPTSFIDDDEDKNKFDYRRTLAFILYGGCYQGVAMEHIYNHLFDEWFGDNAWSKLAFNQLILSPFVTLPVAYIVKGLVFGNSISKIWNDYATDVRDNGLLTTFWLIWTPVNLIIFTIVPPHLRIPFTAVVSFVWMIILSRIANKKR